MIINRSSVKALQKVVARLVSLADGMSMIEAGEWVERFAPLCQGLSLVAGAMDAAGAAEIASEDTMTLVAQHQSLQREWGTFGGNYDPAEVSRAVSWAEGVLSAGGAE